MAAYEPSHRLNQKLASSRFGAWLSSKIQRPLDILVLRLTGKYTATSFLAGLPLIILEVRGAKTNKLRQVPLLCIESGAGDGEIALIASNWGQAHYPAWYRNLKANPAAQGSIKGTTLSYHAHEADGAEYAAYWQRAQDTYPGFANYHRRLDGSRHIPIMVMRPAA